jgi:hypothetical protein
MNSSGRPLPPDSAPALWLNIESALLSLRRRRCRCARRAGFDGYLFAVYVKDGAVTVLFRLHGWYVAN